MDPLEPSIFRYVGGSIASASDAYLAPVIGLLTTGLSVLVAAGVSLYILVVGLLIALGYVAQPVVAFAGKAVRIIVVTSVALSVDAYGTYVIGAIEGFEAMLAGALSIAGTSDGSIYEVLDASLGAGLELVARCFEAADNASWRAMGSIIGWSLSGAVIAIGTVGVVLLGGAIIIVAKFALTLTIVVGPLFIVALIWPPTARYFENWIAQVVNNVFLIAVVVLVISFSTVAFTRFVGQADLEGGTSPIVVACEVFVLSFLLGWITLQVQTWSASLSGGMSTAILSLRHLSTPLRAVKDAGGAARDVADPRSTRRDLESGHLVNARRLNHLVAGNTPANPAYRQHVIAQAGKNWSRAKGGKAVNRK